MSMRVLAACAFLLTVFGCTSSPAADDQSPPTTTFKVNSHLVVLDVVVTDKNGQPVRGLTAGDFSVKENGKLQAIAFFTPPTEAASSHSSPRPLPPGIYSNRAKYRLPGGIPTIIVIDAANTPVTDQIYARQQLMEFLNQQSKSSNPVAVFTLTDHLSLVHDFSTAQQELAAVSGTAPVQAPSSTDLRAPNTAPLAPNGMAATMFAMGGGSNFTYQEIELQLHQRVEVTLLAMHRLTHMFGGIPGRKNIIWLTASLPFALLPSDWKVGGVGMTSSPVSHTSTDRAAMSQYDEKIRDLEAEMTSARISIYPVDVRGLAIQSPVDLGDSQATMRQIAQETGGKAIVNRNDIGNAVATAVNDSTASYSLAYYPTDKNLDPQYRRIEIKVDRQDTEALYRHGYFDMNPEPLKGKKANQELGDALRDQVPDTLVIFDVKVTPIDQHQAHVDFLVDTNSISVDDNPKGKKIDLSFYVAAFSPKGKMLNSDSSELDKTYPLDKFQSIQHNGVLLRIDTNIPSDAKELRLAVKDNKSGSIGTAIAPLAGQK